MVDLTPLQAGIEFSKRPETLWLAIGTVLMALGALYFIARGAGTEDPETRKFYVITALIPSIAFASYMAMLQGYAVTEITLTGGEQLTIYWGRYVDWLFTTPLLLLDLGLLVGVDRDILTGAIGADAFMIVTGMAGALSAEIAFRYAWWTVSTIALGFILYFLWSGFTEKAREFDEATQSTFIVLRNLILVLWSIYPIWWLIGTEGAGLVPLSVETLGFMILDVTAKVVFGFILLRSRAITGEASVPEPSAEGEAAAGD